MTIADLSILPTASTLGFLFPIKEDKWPHVVQWMDELKKLPFYEEINGKGLAELQELIELFLKQKWAEIFANASIVDRDFIVSSPLIHW